MPGTSEGLETRKPEILVVEDNFLTASEICDAVRDCGFSVAGAVGRLKRSLEFLAERHVDGAIVDINLDDTNSYPLCVELERRKVPYCFLTGYDRSIIPSDFRHTPVLSKPCDATQLKSALDTLLRRPPPAAEPPRAARGNRLLDGLASADRAAIDPCLKPVRLSAGQVLELNGTPQAQIFFPETAVISLEVDSNGRRIQAALVGREGVVGAAALVGARVGNRAVVQIEGNAWSASVDDIARQLAANPGLRNRLEEAVNGLVMQLSRTLLATGHATIEQRVARFLLMATERINATDVPITHGMLADTLGVRRAGVTVALHVLEGKQAVRSERKRVRVLDRAALSEAAGGFYHGE